ncbi:hypothetical protein AB0I49_06050 [Streptomyces sp. NPDC050617]|uniref:hypothetical protein n=1 Tax=Streptomyces sp. NPDC050617 TaxID=3154628 RepID=UPI003439D49D
MEAKLTWTVRLCAVLVCIVTLITCFWALGDWAKPPPHTGVRVGAWTVAGLLFVRAGLLWARHRLMRRAPVALSLSKSGVPSPRRPANGAPQPVDSEARIRWRLAARIVLTFSAGLTIMSIGNWVEPGSKLDLLRAAGGKVTEAVVVEAPRHVKEHTYVSDGETRTSHWSSDLMLSVPGAPNGGRMSFDAALTSGEPRRGDRMQVLWSPDRPELHGYIDKDTDLRLYEHGGEWDLTPSRDWVVALILVVALSCFFGLLSIVLADEDKLQRQAWSPVDQTVFAVIGAAWAIGTTRLLDGAYPSDAQQGLAFWGWLLPLAWGAAALVLRRRPRD